MFGEPVVPSGFIGDVKIIREVYRCDTREEAAALLLPWRKTARLILREDHSALEAISSALLRVDRLAKHDLLTLYA